MKCDEHENMCNAWDFSEYNLVTNTLLSYRATETLQGKLHVFLCDGKGHLLSHTLKTGSLSWELNGGNVYVAFYISNYVCLFYLSSIYICLSSIERNRDFLEEGKRASQSQSRLGPIRMCCHLLYLELWGWEADWLVQMSRKARDTAGHNVVPSLWQAKLHESPIG